MKTSIRSKIKKATPAESPASSPNSTAPEGAGAQTVLISVTGQSPAVLTETIWALAEEQPAIVPDRVVVITTSAGRKMMIQELFEPADNCVWDRLRAMFRAGGHDITNRLQFGQTSDDIRVFTWFDALARRKVELADITNEEQNLAAADFIMEQVRGLAADNVRLVGSVAGGRKTMGALLFAVMSLIGRRDDLMTHVLINEPFDSPRLKPRFYFPLSPPVVHTLTDLDGNPVRDREGKPVTRRTDEAKILLGRIPFVALRTLFERDVVESTTYSVLVQRCQVRSEEYARKNVRLRIHRSRLLVDVNGHEIPTSISQHLYLLFLAERAVAEEPELPSYAAAWTEFNQFSQATQSRADARELNDWRHDAARQFDNTSFERFCVKVKNELQTKLASTSAKAALLYPLLPAARRFSLHLPPDQITLVD
ncbi:MAG: CRISPR-associated ring nuclease Csm6 [Limisphaerales bacterium]